MPRAGTRLANGANLLDQVHDAIIVTDVAGKISTWNRAAEQLYGYPRKQVIGENVSILYFPEDLPLLKSTVLAPMKKANTNDVELRARRKDGSPIYVHLRLSALRSPRGALRGIIGCSNDITPLRNATGELRRAYDELQRQVEERTAALKAACDGLYKSEHNRRIVLASSPGVAYACNAGPNFETTFVSDNIQRVFGYSPSHFLTSADLWINHIHPDDQKDAQAFAASVIPAGEGTHQYRFRRADGEYRCVRDTMAAMHDESGKLIGFAGYVSDVTEDVKKDEERRKQERLRVAAETLVSTQEAERKRIARELHDDLMQRVSAFGLEIAALDRDSAGNSLLRRRLRALRRKMVEFSDDLEAIAYQLHSLVYYRKGLFAALEQESAFCRHRAGLRVKLDLDPACQEASADVATCIYRVVQEALRNTIEHSGASVASVTLRKVGDAISLGVEDSGKGFDPKSTASHLGLGITSMSERVHLLNGRFSLESVLGAGTRISIVLPIQGGANE